MYGHKSFTMVTKFVKVFQSVTLPIDGIAGLCLHRNCVAVIVIYRSSGHLFTLPPVMDMLKLLIYW